MFYIFLSLRAGGIVQILQSDWFRERAVFTILPANPGGSLAATWPGLLEAWLVLTSIKYYGNLYILIPLNQRLLALTRLRATGPWLAASFTSLLAKPVIQNHFSFKTCAIISVS